MDALHKRFGKKSDRVPIRGALRAINGTHLLPCRNFLLDVRRFSRSLSAPCWYADKYTFIMPGQRGVVFAGLFVFGYPSSKPAHIEQKVFSRRYRFALTSPAPSHASASMAPLRPHNVVRVERELVQTAQATSSSCVGVSPARALSTMYSISGGTFTVIAFLSGSVRFYIHEERGRAGTLHSSRVSSSRRRFTSRFKKSGSVDKFRPRGLVPASAHTTLPHPQPKGMERPAIRRMIAAR